MSCKRATLAIRALYQTHHTQETIYLLPYTIDVWTGTDLFPLIDPYSCYVTPPSYILTLLMMVEFVILFHVVYYIYKMD